MSTQISNQAILNFTSGTDSLQVSSNTATVTLQGPLELTKNSLEAAYKMNDYIIYTIMVTNTSSNNLTNLVIVDNLGTYAFTTTLNVTPLTYVGPSQEYIDNVFVSSITPTISTAKDSITYNISSLAAGSTLMIEYKVKTNNFSAAIVGTSSIISKATVTATGVSAPVTANHTLAVASYANLEIEKSMSPDPVVDGSAITYTFTIKNYGTIQATNVVLKDTFTSDPTITSLLVDSTVRTDYDHSSGVLLFPGTASTYTYTIPAATFTQNVSTGVVTITPGSSTVIVKGTI